MSIFERVAPETVDATDHCLARWDERTSPGAVAPETAWDEACEMPTPRPHYQAIDELRYYPAEGVVLLRRDYGLLTAIDVVEPTNQRGRALQAAVERQFGSVTGRVADD